MTIDRKSDEWQRYAATALGAYISRGTLSDRQEVVFAVDAADRMWRQVRETETAEKTADGFSTRPVPLPNQKKKRGRPKGSKNKPKAGTRGRTKK